MARRRVKEFREALVTFVGAVADDGEIDELEAPPLAKEINDAIGAVFGKIKGKSAKNLFRSILQDGLKRLDEES